MLLFLLYLNIGFVFMFIKFIEFIVFLVIRFYRKNFFNSFFEIVLFYRVIVFICKKDYDKRVFLLSI